MKKIFLILSALFLVSLGFGLNRSFDFLPQKGTEEPVYSIQNQLAKFHPVIDAPYISLVLFVEGAGEFTERSLDAIINQSYSGYTLYVVGNGCTDQAWEHALEIVRVETYPGRFKSC